MSISSKLELTELVKKLKYEKLFIASERNEIENLNRKVQEVCTTLLQEAWITGQRRLALENLTSPFLNEFLRSEDSNFEIVEAQRVISNRYYQSYVDLCILLRSHPDIVGLCITTYERERQFLLPYISDSGTTPSGVSTAQILHAIINIYGGLGGPLRGDERLHLKLLSVLGGMQVVGAENPRRVLRQGSVAFSTLFRLISETIPAARLFLIGSLHEPVTKLLSSPELLSLGSTMTPTTPISLELSASTPAVNKDIALLDRTDQMARLTKIFLQSILDHIYAFPIGLAWFIQSMERQLQGTLEEKEIRIICVDLIWSLFICPAVTNPEPFGVTDAPVGSPERHILSQVASILQGLALSPYEANSSYINEYNSFFDSSLCCSVLESILGMETSDVEDEELKGLFRRTILLPENQLYPLLSWLKETLVLLERNGKLTQLEDWPLLVKLSSILNESQPPPSPTPSTNRLSPNPSTSKSQRPTNFISNGKSPSFLNRRREGKRDEDEIEDCSGYNILIFPITTEGWEWIGMLPESQLRKSDQKSECNEVIPDELIEEEDRSPIGEKRTRFSISQDDGSIGMSDNLEGVSEGASTHSVSSSIEMEDQNDNLSDMMSANVSGRGTPNVSGRNTPLSQAEESNGGRDDEIKRDDDDVGDENEVMEHEPQNMNPPNINNLNLNPPQQPEPTKQSRSEIDDKFCKFEIKKLYGGDETVSLLSDTWSTDVLASDSEMGGERRLLLLPLPPTDPNPQHQNSRGSMDASAGGETMSEAWSTDVAASDIERLTDFDTEETGSVGRSDDTGRSEPEQSNNPPIVDNSNNRESNRGEQEPPQAIDILLFHDIPHPPLPDSTTGNEGMEIGEDDEGRRCDATGVVVSSSNRSSSFLPKTITFDKTADRGDEEAGKTRKFFKGFKIFRGRGNRKGRGEERCDWSESNQAFTIPKIRKSFSEDMNGPSNSNGFRGVIESSDDILAKYQRKSSLTGFNVLSSNNVSEAIGTKDDKLINYGGGKEDTFKITRGELVVDAKRKLRSVLGNCDLEVVQEWRWLKDIPIDIALLNILRIEECSAISRCDNVTVAHVQEAIRTVEELGLDGSRRLLRQLRDDYRRRSDYISYLIRAKQGLLSTINCLERNLERSRREGETFRQYALTEWIRLKLEGPDEVTILEKFIESFRQLTILDEKIESLSSFLNSRLSFILNEPIDKEWNGTQLRTIGKLLEQYLITRLYSYALFPNGEADIHRDAILRDHIFKLRQIVTPMHKDLKIPKSHLGEYPWPSAQRELRMLSAYRTAGDKLRCVLRVCSLILNLLATSTEKAMAADDFVPVLVFVIIQTNPPSLLSTVQYVNSFFTGRMTGEEEYWWTQFSCAVEFIKTMDYIQ